MKVIGLTGGIGTGKSTVAKLLRERGFVVIDADRIARAVVEPGQPALDKIVREFGTDVLLTNGHLDRKRLATIVFHDPEQRRILERITHPQIALETARQLRELADNGHSVAFYEAPLLFEANRTHLVDFIVVVASSIKTQIARTTARDTLSVDEVQRRIDAQWPIADKVRAADYVVWNDGDLQTLTAEVDRLITSMGLRM